MAVGIHVDARLHAVTGDVGVDEVAKAQLAQVPHDVVEAAGDVVAPAVHLDLPVTRGNVCHEARAEALGDDLGKRRLADEHRAQGDALGPHGAQLVDARERAHAAAHVDGQAVHLADGANRRVVGRTGPLVLLEGARQVHDVHPRGALLGEVPGHGGRVVRVDLAAGAVATLEAHDLARDEIDGWEQNHAQTSFPRAALARTMLT